VVFVHLAGTREEIAAQMSKRSGHYMPLSLLDSQLATLEPLALDENAVVVSVDQPVEAEVAEIMAKLSLASDRADRG
jgi:carbohydrate kinase (thermoresistant glucokinase family)